MASNGVAPTPGMRILCRDAEWLVTRVDPSDRSHKHCAVHCVGADDLLVLSELIRRGRGDRILVLAKKYDGRGRHIPNTTRKNQGGTQFRAARAEWQAAGNDPLDPTASPLEVYWPIDDGLQTVTKTFYPPFTKVDREADYARAYEVFQERYGKGTD